MAINVRRAARFVAMNGSHANIEKQSVDLLFIGEDDQQYAIELDPAVIPPMMITILGHAKELRASLDDDLPSQALQPKNMSVVMNPEGRLAWKIEMESGLDLVLQVEPAQFRALDATFAEMRTLMSRTVQ